jgi:amino acid adenylation domain-containing protein
VSVIDDEERLARVIAGHVAELLGVATVETDAGLWSMGLDSLAAMRLVRRLYTDHGLALRADAALHAGTVAALAKLAAQSARPSRAETGAAEVSVPTTGQLALWLDGQVRPELALGNLVLFGFRMTGPLDTTRLTEAIRQVVRRHDALRTGITTDEDGMPVAVTVPEERALRLNVTEAGGGLAERTSALARAVDVADGPLIAVELQCGDGWTDLVAAVAHIAFDGHSEALFAAELNAFLRGERLPPVRSFAHAYGAQASDRTAPAGWIAELAATEPLTWPGEPPGGAGDRYGRLACDPDEAACRALEAAARTAGVTPFVLALHRFGRALRAVTGARSFRVGVPTAGRDDPAAHATIGYFVREAVVPLRDGELDGSPAGLLETWRQAMRWSGTSPHDLARGIRRAGNRDPIFGAQFIWQNTISADWDVPGVRVEPLDVHPVAPQTDLSLELWPSQDGRIRGALEYDRAVVPAQAAAEVRARFLAELTELTELAELAGPAAQAQADDHRPRSVWRRIREHAERNGDHVALRGGGEQVTYRELTEQALRRAEHLSRRMKEPGELVGIALPNGRDAVVTMLAAMAAGGAFLPLDTACPPERLAEITRDARLRILIDESTPPPEDPATRWSAPPTADDLDALACVFYTSGSTGRPRGVMMPHGPLAAYVRNLVADWHITPADRFVQLSALAWANSGEEIFTCLTAGATLYVEPGLRFLPMGAFVSFVAENDITVLDLPTVFWRELTDFLHRGEAALPSGVRLVVIGGDGLDRHSVRKWQAVAPAGVRLVNTYGSTEFGLALQADIDGRPPPEAPPPIGRPLPGIVAYVDGRPLDTLPAGTTGELAIGGATVARGYLNDPELTAERFRRDGSGRRRFHTRDLVRVREDASLEFVGRIDRQAKIRGNRVDLTEIEALLENEPGVTRAVAVPLAGPDGQTRLVAVVTGEDPDPAGLRAALLRRLPAFAVPDRVLPVADLPLLSSGKKDVLTARQIAAERAGFPWT